MTFRLPLPIQGVYNCIQGEKKEIRLLQYLLVEISEGRIRNAETAANSMEVIAAAMSDAFRWPISAVDVACKVDELHSRFENFIWFKSLRGIQYDTADNRVTAWPIYWERYDVAHHEPMQNLLFRLKGEPNYALLHEVFTAGRLGRLDVQWVIAHCMGGEAVWCPAPVVYWWGYA
ncbi:hypothetical protein C2S52_010617 [Perilla frutescens var. hirtella]|nr:hypothetical protein C2S52_010617 [Perilla frutescens var. hirtella]